MQNPIPLHRHAVGPWRVLECRWLHVRDGDCSIRPSVRWPEGGATEVAPQLVQVGAPTVRVVRASRRRPTSSRDCLHPYIARVIDAGHTPEGFGRSGDGGVERHRRHDHGEGASPGRGRRRLGLRRSVTPPKTRDESLVVHRDLKPSKISSPLGEVKLLDFGIAKLLEARSPLACTRPCRRGRRGRCRNARGADPRRSPASR